MEAMGVLASVGLLLLLVIGHPRSLGEPGALGTRTAEEAEPAGEGRFHYSLPQAVRVVSPHLRHLGRKGEGWCMLRCPERKAWARFPF